MWWGEKNKYNVHHLRTFPHVFLETVPFPSLVYVFAFVPRLSLSVTCFLYLHAHPWHDLVIYIWEHSQSRVSRKHYHSPQLHPPTKRKRRSKWYFLYNSMPNLSLWDKELYKKIISAKRTKRSEPIPRPPSPTSQSFTHKTFIYAHAICYRQDQSVDSTCGGNGGGGGRGCLNLRTSFAKKSTKRSH